MSRPPKREMTISLFSFLDALICTMGALILLLLSMAVKLQEQTRARQAAALKRAAEVQTIEAETPPRILPPAVTVADYAAEFEAERERRRLAWNELLAQSEEERNRRALAAQKQQEAMLTAEQKVRAAEMSLAEIMRQIAAAEAEVGKLETAENELQVRQINAEQQLGLSRRRLDELKKRQANAPSRFALVPFDGTSGTVRQPIYIECTDRGLQFLPEGQLVTADDLDGFSEGFNPLLAGAEALFDYWTAQHRKDPEHVAEPYVLLLVRPSGTVSYYAARLLLTDLKTPFGYELIEENFPLKVPTADPVAKSIVQRAVRITLESRGELASKGERRSLLGQLQDEANQFGQPNSSEGAGGGGQGGGFEPDPNAGRMPMSSNARSPADGLNVRQGHPRRPVTNTGRGNVAGGFGTAEPGGVARPSGRALGSPGTKLPPGMIPGSEPGGMADLRNQGRGSTGGAGTGPLALQGNGQDSSLAAGSPADGSEGDTSRLSEGLSGQPQSFRPERGQITGSGSGKSGSAAKPQYASLGNGRRSGDAEGQGEGGDGSEFSDGSTGVDSGEPGGSGQGGTGPRSGTPGVEARNASLSEKRDLRSTLEEEPIGAKPRKMAGNRAGAGSSGTGGPSAGTAVKGSAAAGKGSPGRTGSTGPDGQKLQSLPEELEEWRSEHAPGSEPEDVLPGTTPASTSAVKQDETFRKIAGMNRNDGKAGPGTGGTRRSIMDGGSGGSSRGKAGDRSELRWGSQSGRTIGLEQDVRVDLYADKITFGPKMPAMPVAQGETRAQLVEKVSARIEHVVAGWGDAPDRFHWIPRVKFIVHPGGNQHYERLNQPLKEWGLSSTMEYSIDAQPEPSPPQAAAQPTNKKVKPVKSRR